MSLAASWTPTTLSATRTTMTIAPPTMSQGFVAQRLPEDREVVRDEERRHGDGDDVDEHLRPRRDEADELVERVPREARRASRFREAAPSPPRRSPRSRRRSRPAITKTSGVSPSA